MSLDPFLPGLFLLCSRPQLLAAATEGTLESSAVRRFRGAYPHRLLSYAKESSVADSLLMAHSKHQFQSELDDAIVARQQPAISADVVGDLPKVRSSQGNIAASGVRHETWNGQIHMVGKVEGFRAQLNCLVFPYGKVSRQGQIQLKRSRAFHAVIAQIAVRPRRGWGESRGVDPIAGGLMLRVYDTRIYQVRRLIQHSR